MMKRRDTFNEVLNNGDDQVVVRHLLYKHVPKEVKAVIIEEFNQKVDERNALEAEITVCDELEYSQDLTPICE